MNRIEKWAKIAGVLICLAFIIFPSADNTIQLILFSVILLSVGIPHGAIDHLISDPDLDRVGLGKFLGIYLTLIGAYLFTWYLIPIFALFAFIVMSAYHFGQSHFLGQSMPISRTWPLYLSRGGFFLFAILLGDWKTTKFILSSLLNLDYLDHYRLMILGLFLATTLVIQWNTGLKFKLLQLIELFVLGFLLYFSPLLIGFVVYFGFWHALPSMMTEYKYLSGFTAYNSVKKFVLQLLPFSLISFIGIGILLALGLNFLTTSELILLFFVLISLISFPHILYMDRFLKKQNQN
jgi:beta-carotene 15,15'-dioxygenase